MGSNWTNEEPSTTAAGANKPVDGERKPLGRPIARQAADADAETPKVLTGHFSSDLHAVDPRSGSVLDRRSGRTDRRSASQVSDTNLERRRGPGIRRLEHLKSAEEGEMNQEQFLFLMAIDAFKLANGKTFPTWTDVLEIIRKLGYRKTAGSELNLGERASDWREKPDAPSGVWKEARVPDDDMDGHRRQAA